MDWREDYQRKKVPVEQALAAVRSGNRVVVGHAAGEPLPLVEEMVRQKDRLRDVEIVHMVALGKCEYCQVGMEKHFRHNSLFAGKTSQQAIADGRADYTPVFFSEIPRLFRDNILPVDVALIQVSRPDKHGFMSYGISVDYTRAAAESARTVIAEVNARMPRTFGSFIHVSRINYLVETDRPLIEIPPPEITEVEERIGRHVASLVPDRANLQLGIGAIPDAVLRFLRDKQDLGIHTEMFSDGVVALYEAGVVTNKYNNVNPGKFTACFLMGTRRLYDFVDDNPLVAMHPVDFTNNITAAGRVNNLISINSAIQVDLFGQVCSDTIGIRQYSGVGGQVDFVRAASLAPGGKSIIAMPSTARKGTISRIVARLDPGSCVTTSRSDVHFVVTEYGIANLRGKSVRRRAKALLDIAHPELRDGIRDQAVRLGIAL
jgi:4-hydroxybutyrate CoA-transferase